VKRPSAVERVQAGVAALVGRVDDPRAPAVDLEGAHVEGYLVAEGREGPRRERVEPPVLRRFVGEDEDLPLLRAVAGVVLFVLVLSEKGSERLLGGVVLRVLGPELAGLFAQEKPAVVANIRHVPKAVRVEDGLLAPVRDVVPVDRVGARLPVVGGEVDGATVGRDLFEPCLHVRRVLDLDEGPAHRRLQIEAGVLFALAVALHDQPRAVRGDRRERGHVLAPGPLQGKPLRPVELPDLRNPRDVPRKVE
jgi:hypothetical protein